MALKRYDADQVVVSFQGLPIDSGFADGEFVRVEYETDAFTDVAGTDGEVTRSKTNDRRSTVTLMLMQTADANATLSAILNADLETGSGSGVGVLVIKDLLSGTTIHQADRAWIQNHPSASYDREATSREWVFRCENMRTFQGGNVG